MTEEKPIALQIESVSFSYPARRREIKRQALSDVSIQIKQGELVALLGPNGCGKSTLFKLICGALQPESGNISVFGKNNPSNYRQLLGVVFQSPSLDPHLSIAENLHYQAGLYGLQGQTQRDVIEQELENMDLKDRSDSIVKTLSKGLARRADLVRALLPNPALLLLDEPTVGLDPSARRHFIDDVCKRRETTNLTVVMSTHLVDEADRCDRVILMHNGELIADDTPVSLRKKLGSKLITIEDGEEPPSEFDDLDWKKIGNQWIAGMDSDIDLSRHIAGTLAASERSFSIAPPTLADAFEELTGSSLTKDDDKTAEDDS